MFDYPVVSVKYVNSRHGWRTVAARSRIPAARARASRYWLSVSTETLEIPECSIAAMTFATAP